MLGVVLIHVDLRDRCVGGEALRADAKAVDVGGELGVFVALHGRQVLSTECASM